MMDTQRLIAFVVFSFSALLLWDAWQKHNAPKPVPGPAGRGEHSRRRASPDHFARAPRGRCARSGAGRAFRGRAAIGGEAVTVKTDLLEVELNTLAETSAAPRCCRSSRRWIAPSHSP
jgi:YidC/Oxa1 family membrane protein insertase